MNNVNYKVLKSNIIKACEQTKKFSMEFAVDYDKLYSLVGDINLVPVKTGMEGKRVRPDLVPYLSEYFEKSKLSWFTNKKFSTIITFVDKESIDDDCQELLDKMKLADEDDPDNDKVNDYATIVANYPCYFATIVSYQSNDPNRAATPSYTIVCRANKVVIKSSDYQYNPRDFS